MGGGGLTSAKIPPKSPRHPSDARLRRVSAGRHHVFTLAQLEREGLSARAVRDRVAAGRLERLYSGVYCIGPPTMLGRWMGAVLACGNGAVLSHRSAAALRGLIKPGGSTIHVTVATRSGRSRAGITVHRGQTLGPSDVAVHRGIPCTSIAHTLLDYAATATPRQLELALGQADVMRIVDAREIHAVLGRNPRRPGSPALSALLAAYTEPAITRSDFEEALHAALDRAGLPRPKVNAYIALGGNTGYYPDLLWPEAGLILEADSQTFHASPSRRRHDARRDRRLKLAGYDTFRWAGDDPSELVSHVTEYLAALDARAAVAGRRAER